MYIRPDLKEIQPEIVEYIMSLEKIRDSVNNNGAVKFMAALNRKLEVLAVQIDDAEINFSNSEEKLYERFLNTVKIGKDVISDFKWFIQEYGEQIKEDDKKSIPLLERLVSQK